VRVCAVTEREALDNTGNLVFREVSGRVLLPEVAADCVVVLGGYLECLERERAPEWLPDVAAALGPRLEKGSVVGRIGEDRDACVVLRGRTEERNAADVNLLDGIGKRAVGFGDGGRERVKIADDDRDWRDALRLKILLVGGSRLSQDT
jgi:hypothetical protein